MTNRINLTDQRIRALRPGDKRHDSQVPGLMVRAHKTSHIVCALSSLPRLAQP